MRRGEGELKPVSRKLGVGAGARFDLPQLGAFNGVRRGAPRDNVTQSLALDAHGKSLSSALLEMKI